MKKQIFLLLMSAACVTSYAQLSVNSDGQVAKVTIICDGTATITGGSVENGGSLTIEAASTNIKRSFAAAKGAELKILKRTKN